MNEDRDLYQTLGRLEGKVDALLSDRARIERVQQDHETRLKTLETVKAQGTGAALLARLAWPAVAAVAAYFAAKWKLFAQ